MIILGKIRKNIGNFIIEKRYNHIRKIVAANLNDAKNIGLVYEIRSDDELFLKELKAFLNSLLEKRKIINLIGYCHLKNIPSAYTKDYRFNTFSSKNLNIFGLPNFEPAESFINKDFDILIDLSKGNSVPIKYITTKSKAKFKVGRYQENNKIYDLMIDTSKNDDNFAYCLEQIKHFLTQINYN
jgi:hypothetical protein